MSGLVYVYAVTEAPVAGDITGIDERPVRWVASSGLAAAVSDVAVADFDEEQLNANVKDMAWLGPRAIAHDSVNGLLWERADAVVPLAFGTVFRDDQRVGDMLQARADDLRQRLTRVRGHGEWVLSLRRVQPPNVDASERVAALREEIAAASAGRAHLLRRRLVEVERAELARLEDQAADEFVRDAERLADGVYVENLPPEAADKPLVRATLLLPDSTDAVARLAERWRRRGYALSESGPTPPYRFAALTP